MMTRYPDRLRPLVLLLPGFSVMAVHGPEPDWCRALGLPADLACFFLLAHLSYDNSRCRCHRSN